ncbi:hypothetical protein [Pontimicrobium sp. SW4]|uniref:Uncharacterized protein n=1 Tax=Pontimicrobium sp. SW4 TaxID=3153519 RepID=A0AAU7BWF2_9FLAO
MLFNSCYKNDKSTKIVIALRTDKQGNVIAGSKEQLITSIRNGVDIKVGWGGKGLNHSIEHLAVPIWLSILDETEVVAHLDPQVLSHINWDSLDANYSDTKMLKEEWRVVITSKGTFDAVWYDRELDTVIKRVPQRHVMTWLVKDVKSEKSSPFFN